MLLLLLSALAALAAAPSWEDALDRARRAVVSIRVNATRSFDTGSAGASYATGFVVDAERGIILTNRHVVQPGPVIAEAIFENNEEVPLVPLYRDPVHDFGFFRYDPADIRFADVAALPLVPSAARVGADIRVMGNDAGEKGTILAGTLARLDRPAPEYGRGRYNDFNTFYIQAASSTSGGSSGSPVFNIRGEVVALNAGSNRSSAASFFLPLDHAVRALRLLQAGEPVPRGTLEAVFAHLPFDEVRRRGLRPETEALIRGAFPAATGMLVVDEIVPGGAAAGALREGDVLVKVGGKPTIAFNPLEELLDASVGGEVAVEVERNGRPLALELPVSDLHAITPAEYLEFGGGVLHALSFQQARSYGVPRRGVYVASPGYALGSGGIGENTVIVAVGGAPTPDLDAAEAALAALPDGAPAEVRFFHLDDPSRERVEVITVDRRWFPMQRCRRDDSAGSWPCAASAAPPPPAPPAPAATTFPRPRGKAAQKLAPSLVIVGFDIPYRTDGVYGSSFTGVGLVLDARSGLVVVDRDTVPVRLGDVTLTFAGSVEIPGRVAWLHPGHNLAFVTYDPALLGDTPVRSAELRTDPLAVGDRIWQVGMTWDSEVVSRRTRVERLRPAEIPLPGVPFFRETNVELIDPQDVTPSLGGVLADRRGRVRASWASFVDLSGESPDAALQGLPAELIAEGLAAWREGGSWQALGAELRPIGLAEARKRGLPADQAQRLEAHDPGRKVLEVVRLMAGSPAASALQEGDLLLSARGAPVTRAREVERAATGSAVAVQVLRQGQVLDLTVDTLALPGEGTTRVVGWAGALLQETPLAVAAQRGVPAEGVYAAWFWYGSPAAQAGLRGTRRIVEVDGQPVADLDAFLAAVAGKGDREAVQLTTERLDGRIEVLTLRQDLVYWPTIELALGEGDWERRQAGE